MTEHHGGESHSTLTSEHFLTNMDNMRKRVQIRI